MQDFNDLYYFVQVVDHKGFAAAGRALGLPKSTLSRRMAKLEENLGVRLLQRSTRSLSVTEVGQRYYEHCKAMQVQAEAAQSVIDTMRTEPRGVIRITCPIALLHAHVGRMLGEFMAQCSQVQIHLEATNRRVDVIGEGVDVAIRVRPPPLQDSDLVLRVLADRGQCLVASPALVKQHHFASTPAQLAGLPSLGLGTPQQQFAWVLHGPGDAQATIPFEPRFITTDMIALRNAALHGVGVVQLPVLMVREQLEHGELVKLLPEWSPRREVIHAVFASRRGLIPAVRVLLDFLAEKFRVIEEE
ncbi:LysR family transcriptional regulator [Limnobacter sp.]|uniref:LysR family transcriptional regulator n=1 Tax=Limnobacter sp. TaxID=2003368 RepID=UPI0035155DC3